MARFESIKQLLALSCEDIFYADDIVHVHLPMVQTVYDFASTCSEQNLISQTFSFVFKGQSRDRVFSLWDELPSSITNGNITTFGVSLNLKSLRMNGIHVYYDENELIEICPLSPERFLIIKLGINNGDCTICPDEYSKNEIARYRQVKKIWDLLSSCSDHQDGHELIFLYKQKISVTLNYNIKDLEHEFDGFAKLDKIFSDELHMDAKCNIMRSTLHSFLWREKRSDSFRKLLAEFTLFSLVFEENYRAFSVGFSFDKIRKEYSERFRDYLSKLNGIMYDTLTRALSIPISSLISFVAMKGDFSGSSAIINVGALLLVLFASINIWYLVKFQSSMIRISQSEYKDLFDNIRTELKDLELIELSQKEEELNDQSKKVISTLNFVQSISICNLILNAALFIITIF
ncbi:hypothetical protein ED486_21605 [Salmonella enterica subsp. enterica]|nr:hypothetical protein [Salmonella enterica subsp. enterica serovar Aberdeen]EBH7086689.1 hypothetical protein [Salmonella enterica]EBR7948942.1 hypothetical protein [Salmonella enterica subsp. enterica serovar Stanley]EBV5390186.1 hypothetical protein [Salmonella enterica subsp. enterica serovar Tananarive]EDJ1031102.1 hypothetical protein [Salmonella enterica subsp. enterica serovar Chester]